MLHDTLIYFSLLQQQEDKKTFVVGGHFLMGVCQHFFSNLRRMEVNFEVLFLTMHSFDSLLMLT